MENERGVIVDTYVWVPFFNQPAAPEKRAVNLLLNQDRVVTLGPLGTEILLGFKRDEHAAWVASELEGLLLVTPTWKEWCDAAALGRELASRKHVLPLTDLVVAAVALSRGLSVYTTDPHFDLIPELSRFKP